MSGNSLTIGGTPLVQQIMNPPNPQIRSGGCVGGTDEQPRPYKIQALAVLPVG